MRRKFSCLAAILAIAVSLAACTSEPEKATDANVINDTTSKTATERIAESNSDLKSTTNTAQTPDVDTSISDFETVIPADDNDMKIISVPSDPDVQSKISDAVQSLVEDDIVTPDFTTGAEEPEISLDNSIQAVVQLPVVSEEETRWYIRVDENGETLEAYSSMMTEVIYDHTRNKAQINLNGTGDYLIVVDLMEGSDSVVTDKTFSIYTSEPAVVGSANVVISEMDMTIESDLFGTLLYTRGG